MAYPSVSFVPISPEAGIQPITATSATQAHTLGKLVRGRDSTYGEGEFIYLKGALGTAPGDVVIFDSKAGTTTRAVAASRGPVAVAMSANVVGQFGWYAISGAIPVNTTAAGTGAANSLLAVTATAGQATVSGTAAQKVDGAICTSAQDAPGAGFTVVQMDRPAANGNT